MRNNGIHYLLNGGCILRNGISNILIVAIISFLTISKRSSFKNSIICKMIMEKASTDDWTPSKKERMLTDKKLNKN